MRSGRACPKGGLPGFILVEVMAAIVLLGILVGPLFAASETARAAARSAREKVARLAGVTPDDGATTSGGWTARVGRVDWEGGPLLRVELTLTQSDVIVGAWADGWLLGEWPTGGDREFRLGPDVLGGLFREELVLRVRVKDGEWGPPWRAVVDDGTVPDLAGASAGAPEGPDQPAFGDVGTILHVHTAGSPTIDASWIEPPVEQSIDDLAFVLSGSSTGVCRLAVGGRVQSWCWEEGRGLDVYF